MRRIIYCLLALCLCACTVQQTEENGEISETVATTTTPKTVEEVVTTKWVSPIATAGDLLKVDPTVYTYEHVETTDKFAKEHDVLDMSWQQVKLEGIEEPVYEFTI